MPKKRNAYYFYMLKFKEKMEASGISISIEEASKMASSEWQDLTPDEKRPYELMAEKSKNSNTSTSSLPVHTRTFKYTTQGVPLQQLQEQQQAKTAENLKATESICKLLSAAQNSTGIENYVFHVIHLNVFCAGIPAEIGMAKFSIKDGLIDTFHEFIAPKKLPLGMAYEAKKLSSETHQLPLPPEALGTNDWVTLVNKMTEFCSGARDPGIIFARENEMEAIQEGLKSIFQEVNVNFQLFKIRNITELLYQTRQLVYAKRFEEHKNTYSHVELLMSYDVHEFEQLGCDIHNEMDCNTFCSQSIVKRMAYLFISHCLPLFDITPLPGFHIPKSYILQNQSFKDQTTINDKNDSTHGAASKNDNTDIDDTSDQRKILSNTNPFVEDEEGINDIIFNTIFQTLDKTILELPENDNSLDQLKQLRISKSQKSNFSMDSDRFLSVLLKSREKRKQDE